MRAAKSRALSSDEMIRGRVREEEGRECRIMHRHEEGKRGGGSDGEIEFRRYLECFRLCC